MLKMFGIGGSACPRCEHRGEQKREGQAAYCAGCGLLLGAPRHKPVLVDNRWAPGPDELAVFFGVRALSGIFVKTLHVPATARAYILQGGQATEVPQGEYEIEGFFTRLNNLLRDQHAEILVTRSGALPVEFSLQGLTTCEHLLVDATLTLSLKIENVPAFARHFMTMPGTIKDEQLRELIAPSVAQLAQEFVAARSLRDMAGQRADRRELRLEFDQHLQGGLALLLSQYGLAVVRVDTIALKHDKFDATAPGSENSSAPCGWPRTSSACGSSMRSCWTSCTTSGNGSASAARSRRRACATAAPNCARKRAWSAPACR